MSKKDGRVEGEGVHILRTGSVDLRERRDGREGRGQFRGFENAEDFSFYDVPFLLERAQHTEPQLHLVPEKKRRREERRSAREDATKEELERKLKRTTTTGIPINLSSF